MENPPAGSEEPSDVMVETKEAIEETVEKVKETVQEEMQSAQPQGKCSYWKTYPGIWKLLQFGFGTIAMICAIISVIPVCDMEPKRDLGDKAFQACEYKVNGKVEVRTLYDDGYLHPRYEHDLKYKDKGWYSDNPEFLNATYHQKHMEKNRTKCYCCLLQKDDQATHIKIPIWLAFAILTWIVNIVVLVLQWKDNTFVMKKKFPLMIYYGIMWLVIDLASTCGIFNSIWYKVWYDVNVPQFWATIIGSVCGEINAIFHTLCFHWNYIHKMP